MKYTTRKIILKTARPLGKRVPSDAIGEVLIGLSTLTRRAVRMAFQGCSTGSRRPPWLTAASDLRFVDHRGDRNQTVLLFEVPTFGEAAGQLYRSDETSPRSPGPAVEDTGFDVLGDVIEDVSKGDANSGRFDSALLKAVAHLGRIFDGVFEEIRITGHRHPKQHPAVVNAATIRNADRLASATPRPRRARAVGTLVMIRPSTHSFALRMEDGTDVSGVLTKGNIEHAGKWIGQTVVVPGRAVYRPSGALLRFEAERIRPAENESSIWSKIPGPVESDLSPSSLRQPQGPRDGLSAIVGKWPGDESDEEVQRMLEEIS